MPNEIFELEQELFDGRENPLLKKLKQWVELRLQQHQTDIIQKSEPFDIYRHQGGVMELSMLHNVLTKEPAKVKKDE